MQIITPHIEKTATSEIQKGQNFPSGVEDFESIFSDFLLSNKKGVHKEEEMGKLGKYLVQLFENLDLSDEEKRVVFNKIEQLLANLQEDQDGKNLFKAWKNGELNFVIPLFDSGDHKNNPAQYLLITPDKSEGKSQQTNPFELSLLQENHSGQNISRKSENSSLKNILKTFMPADETISKKQFLVIPGRNFQEDNALYQSLSKNDSRTNADFRMHFITMTKSDEVSGKISTLLHLLNGKMIDDEKSGFRKSGKGNRGTDRDDFFARMKKENTVQANQKKVTQKAENNVRQQNNGSDGSNAFRKSAFTFSNSDNLSALNIQEVIDGTGFSKGFGEHISQLNSKSVFSQVVQKIESMLQQVKLQRNNFQPQVLNANVALKPESLGSVMLNLKFNEGIISGTILAATKEAKSIIEANLPALKDALQHHQVNVQNIEVNVQSELEREQQNAFAENFSKEQRDSEESDSFEKSLDLDEEPLSLNQTTDSTHRANIIQNNRVEYYA